MTLQIHEGISFASPNPPQTPPITLSLDDLLAFLKFSQVVISTSVGFYFFLPKYLRYVFYPVPLPVSFFISLPNAITTMKKGIVLSSQPNLLK